MRLGIRARLLIGFGSVLMLTVIVGITGLLSLRDTTLTGGSLQRVAEGMSLPSS